MRPLLVVGANMNPNKGNSCTTCDDMFSEPPQARSHSCGATSIHQLNSTSGCSCTSSSRVGHKTILVLTGIDIEASFPKTCFDANRPFGPD